MKKTYISPASETVVLVARHQMLAGSNPELGYDSDATVTPGGVGGRGYFFDDEFDDEEY